MTQDAAQQLRRLLHLIPRLADGEAHPLAKVAQLAGTDVETIFADLYALSERYEDPGGFVPGLQVSIDSHTRSVQLRASHFARPMRVTTAELSALELGLAMLRGERPPTEHRAIDRARERLRKAIAKLPADPIPDGGRHAELGTHADPAHLAGLREAVRTRRKARLTYRSADAAESHARTVAPYALVAARGAWYVVAHCDDRNAIRIFRLDRIEAVKLTTHPFTVPESFSLESVVDNGRIFAAEEPQALRVRYSPHIARWIAEREGVPLDTDGSVAIEHPLADTRWAVRHVLQYGADAEVLSPPSVREEIAKRLRAMVDG